MKRFGEFAISVTLSYMLLTYEAFIVNIFFNRLAEMTKATSVVRSLKLRHVHRPRLVLGWVTTREERVLWIWVRSSNWDLNMWLIVYIADIDTDIKWINKLFKRRSKSEYLYTFRCYHDITILKLHLIYVMPWRALLYSLISGINTPHIG